MLMHCNVHNMKFLTELNCASIFYVKYCDLYVLRCDRLVERSFQLNECHKEIDLWKSLESPQNQQIISNVSI